MSANNQPVRRAGSRQYVLLTLLSFAASVIFTRLFLQLTGYPKVGGATLHIAHVLWGGLLLFIAALLPLVLANRWVYRLTALLGGAGVGLFIDEVGKFITQSNDYFFPAAAPIIYAFFLLTVLIYLQLRRPPARGSRARLYEVLDRLSEVLDRDLEPGERQEMEAILRPVAQDQSRPDLALLANSLLQFLAAETPYMAREEYGPWDRLMRSARLFEARYLDTPRIRVIAVTGLLLLFVYRVALFVGALVASTQAGASQGTDIGSAPGALAQAGPLSHASTGAELVTSGLQLAAAVPILVAAILLLLGHEKWAVIIGRAGLIFSLTAVDLVVFYVNQFGAVAGSIAELALLLLLTYYWHRTGQEHSQFGGLKPQATDG
jgi:hypothetical protein